jgi:hypothetical protein
VIAVRRNRTVPSWVVIAACLIAAGVFAGSVIGAQFGPLPDSETEASLRTDVAVRVAEIPSRDGLPSRSVLVQPTSTGLLCLWDAANPSTLARQGGCNEADDPLAGRRMTISLAYEGGPATTSVKDARLIGLASSDVALVQIVMNDGTRRTVSMRRDVAVASEAGRFRAFGYRFPTSDFRRGLGPTAVVGIGVGGQEIERLSTGYGG